MLGPFRLGTTENFLEPGFATQLRLSVSGSTDSDARAQVELRRLRLSLRGRFLDGRLTFFFQMNTTPAALELIDVWANVRFLEGLELRVGQFKTPFTRFRGQSFLSLSLADWPVFSTHFGSERQLGLLVHDGGGDGSHWVYQVGVFTGVNARASFARGLADVYAEALTNPSDLRTFHGPTSLHPELVARVGHEAAGVHSAQDSDERGGGLRHSLHFSAAWDLRPAYPIDFSARLAPEVLLKWNHVFLDVVAAAGWFKDAAGAVGLASVGENVEAGWRFSPRWEVTGRFSRVDNTDAVRTDALTRAQGLIAAAPADEQADVRAQYASAGTPRWRQEVAAGLNVYLLGDGLKWQTDLTWTRTVSGATTDEVRLRSQLQLAF
ncbi:MAG: porin [Myxococcota bacterium]